jgi:exonuclease SbcC
MRIERVVIENLNSLAGRFEIDLCDRAYSGGLFAIVGPSGAGKTTVMDAICLALYGRTPRIGTISDTQDELMNKYENACAAEVVFTSHGKRYRSRFEHSRTARGSKPFRAAKRELYEQAADGKWDIVAASIREAAAKIEELTGLNFERFTRSIMLAQFRFAEFLQADSNDRAAILEQMTDMDIYRRISMAVYERAKNVKLVLQETRARIAEVSAEVLSEEETAARETELERLTAAIPVHTALKEKLADCINRITRLKDKQAELKRYQDNVPELKKALADRQAELAQAEKQEQAQKQAQAALAETLKSVRALDQQIAMQQAEIDRLTKEIGEDKNRIRGYKNKILELFKKYFPDASNETYNALYRDPNVGPRLLKSAQNELDAVQNELENLQAQRNAALKGRDEAYWQRQADMLGIAVPVAEALAEIAERQEKLKRQRKRADDLVAREKELEQPAKDAEDKLLYARLEQRFGKERQCLKDGEPCPLCGSTEHPGADKPFDEQWLKQCKAEREAAQSALKDAQREAAQAAAAAGELAKLIAEKESFVQQQSAKLKGQDVDLSDAAALKQLLADAQIVLRTVGELAQQRIALQEKVTRLTEKLGGVNNDVREIDNFRQVIRDVEEQKTQRERALDSAEEAAKKLREERERLFGSKDPNAEEAAAEALAQQLAAVKEQRRTAAEQTERAVQQNERDIARTQGEITEGEKQLNEIYAAALTECFAVAAVSDVPDTAALFEAWDNAAARLGEAPEEDALRCALDALDALIAEQTAQKGAVAQILKVNAQGRSKLKSLKDEEESQKKAQQKWDRLNALIGSADGSKFSRIAQSITFESLLRFANMSLSRMSDRYVLVRDDSNAAKPLELMVIDTYQAGERRPVTNLSGGESFIVSLALALGLSEMSSGRARIDSLFIDEGFASLDEDYMEAALQTLSALSDREGKLVGVISHVEALKERIDVQIEVKKLSGGRSTLAGPGVKAEA